MAGDKGDVEVEVHRIAFGGLFHVFDFLDGGLIVPMAENVGGIVVAIALDEIPSRGMGAIVGHGRGLVVVGIIIVDETEDDNAEDEEKRERVKRKAHEKRPFRAGSSMARRVARAAGSRRPFSMASIAARA